MRVALVGCGFVSEFYLITLPNHPQLELAGVTDRDRSRARKQADHYPVGKIYDSVDDVLGDPSVDIVVNLTNPASHFEVSKRALQAGKHVYSEKPLAMELAEAKELVSLARSSGLEVAGAPCNVLSASAQTLWRAIRDHRIGPTRLVYAQLDDGMIPRQHPQHWASWTGTPWPAKDEFEVGCTLEHAGYFLTWLATFFGPVLKVEAASRCLLQDKGIQLDRNTADFSTALLEFGGGIVARLTCSILGPLDHSISVVGEEGVLSVDDCWFYASPVSLRRPHPKTGFLERPRGLPLVRNEDYKHRYDPTYSDMDYARGVAELADAINERRPCRLGAEFTLHVTEVALAIQHPERYRPPYCPTTRFERVEPMPWAE